MTDLPSGPHGPGCKCPPNSSKSREGLMVTASFRNDLSRTEERPGLAVYEFLWGATKLDPKESDFTARILVEIDIDRPLVVEATEDIAKNFGQVFDQALDAHTSKMKAEIMLDPLAALAGLLGGFDAFLASKKETKDDVSSPASD